MKLLLQLMNFSTYFTMATTYFKQILEEWNVVDCADILIKHSNACCLLIVRN